MRPPRKLMHPDALSFLVSEISWYARMAGEDVCAADVYRRYESLVQEHGEEEAYAALQNERKRLKRIAEQEEARLFELAQAENVRAFGCAPAHRYTLKIVLRYMPGDMLRSMPATLEYKRRFL